MFLGPWVFLLLSLLSNRKYHPIKERNHHSPQSYRFLCEMEGPEESVSFGIHLMLFKESYIHLEFLGGHLFASYGGERYLLF